MSENEPTAADENKLIAEPAPAEGPSPTRRWGAGEHLERLTDPGSDSPINWQEVYERDQRLIRSIIDNPAP